MDKIYVVFWTQGGNTQAMAEAIGEGIREAGKEAEVVFVTGANLDELKAAPKFALGCPAMGAEVLEESEMEPFVCDVEGFIRHQGKNSLCTGYWKVYADKEGKQRLFEKYEYARENLIQLLHYGLKMTEIIDICGCTAA